MRWCLLVDLPPEDVSLTATIAPAVQSAATADLDAGSSGLDKCLCLRCVLRGPIREAGGTDLPGASGKVRNGSDPSAAGTASRRTSSEGVCALPCGELNPHAALSVVVSDPRNRR